MSLNVLRPDVIISRLVEAVIVICINHILEAVRHIAARHTAIIHQAVLLKVVQAVLAAAIVINQTQQITHLIAVALKSTTTKKSTYDDGYDDIYMDGDYDYDRYDSDSDYADGVDDAMDEFGDDW